MSSSRAGSRSLVRRLLPFGCLGVLVAAGIALLIPQVQDTLLWEWERLTARMHDTVDPHPLTISTPAEPPELASVTSAVLITSTPGLPVGTAPTATPPVLPPAHEIPGVTQTYQHPNNCGPATLATDLSFWGWLGTQANIAASLKPDPRDRNVSPSEMLAFVQGVGLKSVVRVGGSADEIKHWLVAGIPIIVEKATLLTDDDPTGGGWAGHYTLVTGYSDDKGTFTTQDSLEGPNLLVSYTGFQNQWRSFNYLYLLVYPPAREAEVQTMLGEDADPQANSRRAALQAQQEIGVETGEDQAFAWFNLGTNLSSLGDFANAANAFDQARRGGLPWRMLWYQFGPYEAYYHTGRYQDVVDLANETLSARDNLEESYYWRGMARLALGDKAGAIDDWQNALKFNRNFAPAAKQLEAAGK